MNRTQVIHCPILLLVWLKTKVSSFKKMTEAFAKNRAALTVFCPQQEPASRTQKLRQSWVTVPSQLLCIWSWDFIRGNSSFICSWQRALYSSQQMTNRETWICLLVLCAKAWTTHRRQWDAHSTSALLYKTPQLVSGNYTHNSRSSCS